MATILSNLQNLRPRDFLVIIGVIILIFSLVSSMSLVTKAISMIISVILILFGTLIDTPLLERFSDKPPERIITKEDRPHEFQK